jgi:threonine dehydratase
MTVNVNDISKAYLKLKKIVSRTPLIQNLNLSALYDAHVVLKREDLQVVRSYKIRGAYNKISSLSKEELDRGIVCASAGNHAQGVAYSCNKLGVQGVIFMPNTTPSQKEKQVRMFGKEFIEIHNTGDTFDAANAVAIDYAKENNMTFIHPFDDLKVIEGQGTVGLEILEDIDRKIDYLLVPVGGGGLISGILSYFKELSPETKVIGIEPEGAPSMKNSMEKGVNTTLESIDSFVDGAAVKRVGDITFEITRKLVDDMITVPEGSICSTILKMYNEEAIVVEPAGALTISALGFLKEKIKGKCVVCIVSGSNNDITRTEEIKERSLLYEGLKHYFIIRFPQRAGALMDFLQNVLGPNDDIAHFEYSKKNSREQGPALIGIELQNRNDFDGLIERMKKNNVMYEYLNTNHDLLQYIL